MDKIKDLLKGKPVYVKVILLIALGIIIYFTQGCAFKADEVFIKQPDFSISSSSKVEV